MFDEYGYDMIKHMDLEMVHDRLKEDVKYTKGNKDESNREAAIDKKNRMRTKCQLYHYRWESLKDSEDTKQYKALHKKVDVLLDQLENHLINLRDAIAEW